MYKVTVGEEEIEVTAEDLQSIDLVENGGNGSYHILKNSKAYQIQYLQEDELHKNLKLLVNGSVYSLKIKDKYDQLVESMGLSVEDDNLLSDIKAPMPGLILDIMVKVGDEVEEGSSLLILEAMKMENVIKASGSGIVKAINKSKKDTVEKGEVILEME